MDNITFLTVSLGGKARKNNKYLFFKLPIKSELSQFYNFTPDIAIANDVQITPVVTPLCLIIIPFLTTK